MRDTPVYTTTTRLLARQVARGDRYGAIRDAAGKGWTPSRCLWLHRWPIQHPPG